jgi:hypothetical protein
MDAVVSAFKEANPGTDVNVCILLGSSVYWHARRPRD